MKQKFGKFSENDDRFLKEYFQKQEKVKDGLLKRLDSSINKIKVRGWILDDKYFIEFYRSW